MSSSTIDRLDGLSSSVAIKGPCRVATTADIALYGLQTIDGIALAEGERVLVKDQVAAYENGIYVTSTGQWRRSRDFNKTRDVVKGTGVFVSDGLTHSGTQFLVMTNDPVVVGTSTISFAVSSVLLAAEAARDAAEAAAAQAEAATDPFAGFYADGSTSDDANFAMLETTVQNRTLDMRGRSFAVSTVPTGNFYQSGLFIVSANTVPGVTGRGIVTAPQTLGVTTGAIEPAYVNPVGGVSTFGDTPTVSGRSTTDLKGLFASSNCRSDTNRSVNVSSIYSWATGNVSGNFASRQSVAGAPQTANIACEEAEAIGFQSGNFVTQGCDAEGSSTVNIGSDDSGASGHHTGTLFSYLCKAGQGRGLRTSQTYTANGELSTIAIKYGGQGYTSTATTDLQVRQFQPTLARAPTDVTVATDIITVPANTLSFTTGDATSYSVSSGGTAIGGLAGGTTYYWIRLSNTQVKLATTRANALANVAIDLTSQGAGTHTFSTHAAFNPILSSGSVTGFNITNRGWGYSGVIDLRISVPGEYAAIIASARSVVESQYTLVMASDNSVGSARLATVMSSDWGFADGALSTVIGMMGTSTNLALASADRSHAVWGVESQALHSDSVIHGKRGQTASTDRYTWAYAASGAPSSANRSMDHNYVTGSLQVKGSVTGSATFSDFAEMFENETLGVIPVGTPVSLVNDRVRPWQEGEILLGVISKTAQYVCGDSWDTWQGRYLTGEFGERIMGDVWDVDKQANVWGPLENPDFDTTRENVPRSERPEEWSCVGVLGQVFLRTNHDVAPGDVIAGRLTVMRVTKPFDGDYGVAKCLIR